MSDIAVAVHGGAGDIPPERKQGKRRADYEVGLRAAAQAAWDLLAAGGEATAAAVAAVCVLENNPLFNAGHGAALCADGTAELDAAIMRGSDRQAGAVAGVRRIKNPIRAAQQLLDHRHVLLIAEAADAFAAESGLEMVERNYFLADERLQQWRERDAAAAPTLDHESGGTVGAVVRDRDGHLAAATSTGGMTGQLPGRVGDSPIIGAGTWAADGVAAISATGSGEAFMRSAFAKGLADRISLCGKDPATAAVGSLDEVAALGGKGGCIVMPAQGAPLLPLNSQDMLRAWTDTDGVIWVAIEADAGT